MKKRILSVLLSLCMVCTLLPTTALAAEGDPPSTPTQNEISNFEQLQAAFSSTGGEYTLAADITVTQNLQWKSNERLTIHGNGHTIQPEVTGLDEQGIVNDDASVINIIYNSGTLTLENLTIYGGKGRCIVNDLYGTLTMTGVSLERAHRTNRTSTINSGAGLYNALNAKALLTNCNIRRNGCDSSGGGFYNNGTLIMENCAIVENRNFGNRNGGGAGENYDSRATLYMNNCTVANNQSAEVGGGLNNFFGTAYIMNSTFTGNVTTATAAQAGGGIGNNQGTVYAVNSVFAFNYANSGASDIGNSGASDIGIYDKDSTNVNLYNCAYGTIRKYSDSATLSGIVSACKELTGDVSSLFNGAHTSGIVGQDGVENTSKTFARPAVTEFKKDGFTSYGVYLKDSSENVLLKNGTTTYYERTDSTVKMSYLNGSKNTALGDKSAVIASNEVTTYQDGTTGRTGSVIGALSSPPPHSHPSCGIPDCTNGEHNHSQVASWTKLTQDNLSTFAPSNQLTPGSYYLGGDITLDNSLALDSGTTNICLNGHKITNNSSYYAFDVDNSTAVLNISDCAGGGTITGKGAVGVSSGTLNLYSGSITGNTRDYYGGGVFVHYDGTFNMYGGSITGNTVTSDFSGRGGGVYVLGTFNMYGGKISENKVTTDANNNGGGGVMVGNNSYAGTFNMYGGEITGNSAAFGGGVYYYTGTFTMTGGSIKNNDARTKGGGVYYWGATSNTFSVSGTPQITGNTLNKTQINNVYCIKTIYITGILNTGAEIGVNYVNNPATTPKTITSGWNTHMSSVADEDIANYFTADVSAQYGICKVADGADAGELELYIKHEHSWTYSASDATITATCGGAGNCDATNKTLTIQAPSDLVYSGSPKEATLSANSIGGIASVSASDIKYYTKSGDSYTGETNDAPTDAGEYKASITVVTGESAVTASVEYTISSKEVTNPAIEVASGSTYDGTAKEPGVTVKDSGMVIPASEYTVTYSDNINAGTATVSIEDKAGGNYTVNGSTTFTIAKGTQTITVPSDKTIIKNGVAVDISTWARVAGATNGTDPGTLTYALGGTYDGVTLVGNQLKVEPSATASTITIKVTAAETDNYNSAEETFGVTVNEKASAALTVTQDGWTYGDATVTPNYTEPEGTIDSTIKVTYAAAGSSTFEETVPTNAGDYTVKVVLETATTVYTGTADFTISKKQVSITGLSVTDKEYDGNTNATVTGTAVVSDKVGSDDVTVTTGTASFADKNVGTGKTVTFTGYSLTGAAAANYQLTAQPASVTAAITAKTVTLTGGISATNRAYNGENTVTLTKGDLSFTGLVGTETLDVNIPATGTITDVNVGSGKTVTYSVTLANGENGGLAANYTLSDTLPTVTVNITPLDIGDATVGTFTAMTYNGTARTPSATVTKNGLTVTGTWSNVTNVGEKTTFTATGNFTGTIENVDPGMKKAVVDKLDLTTLVTAPVNGGTPQSSFANQTQYTGTISWSPSHANFHGNTVYTATLTLTATANYTFTGVAANSFTYSGATVANEANFGTVTITFPTTSNAAVSSIAIKTAATKTAYKVGDPLDVTGLTITATMDDSTTLNVPVTTGMVSGFDSSAVSDSQTLTITYGGKTTTYTVSVGKADQTISAANITAVYGDTGKSVVATNTTGTQGGKIPGTLSYAVTAGSDVVEVDAGTGALTIKKAGTATVTVTAAETATCAEKTENVTVTVNKPTITVTALPQSIYVNGTVPASPVLGTHYTVEGLVGDDTLGGDITMTYQKDGVEATPDVTTPGTYDIVLSGAEAPDANNYDIRYVSGTLTISTRPSSGGSSTPTYKVESEVTKDTDGSVSFSKSSAKKGDSVTITVTPDRYYKVDGVTVKDSSGKEIAVTDNGDGTFTFKMPASKVTVEPVFSWDNPFTDVSEEAYYTPAVEWALKNDITNGTGDGTTFSPDAGCTRAQIVTFLWKAAGCPEPADASSFTDVSEDAYYAKAVAWAVENGITGGTGDGKFSPDATCTRSQSAAFLYRAAGSPAVSADAAFSDVAADAYYADAVAWAAQNGVTGGTGNGKFSPANECTRAQIVTFLYRWMVN